MFLKIAKWLKVHLSRFIVFWQKALQITYMYQMYWCKIVKMIIKQFESLYFQELDYISEPVLDNVIKKCKLGKVKKCKLFKSYDFFKGSSFKYLEKKLKDRKEL